MAVEHFVPNFRKNRITRKIPDQFPVLVISSRSKGSYSAEIVHYNKLDDYVNTMDNFSFVVPTEHAEELNRQVEKRKDPLGHDNSNRFEVNQLPDGRQRLVVYGGLTHEDRNVGWYVADSHSFKPEYHRYYYTGRKVFYTVPYMLGAACFAWYIAWRFSRYLNRRQTASNPVQE